MRAKNPSLPMSLKPKLSWVAEEEAAHHRKLKNLMGGGEGWLMNFFA
jgi:rubrerythrin